MRAARSAAGGAVVTSMTIHPKVSQWRRQPSSRDLVSTDGDHSNRRNAQGPGKLRRNQLPNIIFVLLTALALFVLGLDASAQSKKCPKGYKYDETSGQCVSSRGSG